MFGRYTVLFIGYSHGDPVMNYLARGLPPAARPSRFALAHDSDDSKWVHLGIRQVSYPVIGDDHGSLVALFETWVREIESGLAQRYQRLATLAATDPSILNNDDADFVRRSLSHGDTARRFVESARGSAWVGWLEKMGLLGELLRLHGDVGEAQEQIVRWLVTNFWMTNDELFWAWSSAIEIFILVCGFIFTRSFASINHRKFLHTRSEPGSESCFQIRKSYRTIGFPS
jgi:hypothetical protein